MLSLTRRWLAYLGERSPPAALLIVGAGISLAPLAYRRSMDWAVLAIGVAGIYGLLVLMRLGDELKDLPTDRIVHPQRPLPRGLLTVAQARAGMLAISCLLLAGAGAGAWYGNRWGGILLFAATFYIWLMHKEFFIGHLLSREPMLNAFIHQLVVFPLYAWPGGFASEEVFASSGYWAWLLYNFGASMTFEVCRKLDPRALPLQRTYLHHYGAWATAAIVSVFVMISIGGGLAAGQQAWLLPVQIPLLLSLLWLPLEPARFKVIEGLSVVSAAWHIWVPASLWAVSAWAQR